MAGRGPAGHRSPVFTELGAYLEVRDERDPHVWFQGKVRDTIESDIPRVIVCYQDPPVDSWATVEATLSQCRMEPPAKEDDSWMPKLDDHVEVLRPQTASRPMSWVRCLVRQVRGGCFFVSPVSLHREQDLIVKREQIRPVSSEPALDRIVICREVVRVPRNLTSWMDSQDAAGCISQVRVKANLLNVGRDANNTASGLEQLIILVGEADAVELGKKLLLDVHLKHQEEMYRCQEKVKSLEGRLVEYEERMRDTRIEFAVKDDLTGNIIGKNGQKIRAVQEEFDVKIQVLDRRPLDARDMRIVRVIGQNAESVEAARKAIEFVREGVPLSRDDINWVMGPEGFRSFADISKQANLLYCRFNPEAETLEICGLRDDVQLALSMVQTQLDYKPMYQRMGKEEASMKQELYGLTHEEWLLRKGKGKGKGKKGKFAKGKGKEKGDFDGKGFGKGPIGKGLDGKGFGGKGLDGKGFDGKSFDGKGFDGKGFGGKGFDGKGGFNGKGFDGKGFDGKGFDGKSFDVKGFNGKGFDAKGVGGKGAGAKGPIGKPGGQELFDAKGKPAGKDGGKGAAQGRGSRRLASQAHGKGPADRQAGGGQGGSWRDSWTSARGAPPGRAPPQGRPPAHAAPAPGRGNRRDAAAGEPEGEEGEEEGEDLEDELLEMEEEEEEEEELEEEELEEELEEEELEEEELEGEELEGEELEEEELEEEQLEEEDLEEELEEEEQEEEEELGEEDLEEEEWAEESPEESPERVARGAPQAGRDAAIARRRDQEYFLQGQAVERERFEGLDPPFGHSAMARLDEVDEEDEEDDDDDDMPPLATSPPHLAAPQMVPRRAAAY